MQLFTVPHILRLPTLVSDHFNILHRKQPSHTRIFHVLCFLYATNNSLEAAALEKSKGSGWPDFLYLCFCHARMLCSVFECLNEEGLGRTQILWKMGGSAGGLNADVEEEGRRDGGMLLSFLKGMTLSAVLVINSEWKSSAGLHE